MRPSSIGLVLVLLPLTGCHLLFRAEGTPVGDDDDPIPDGRQVVIDASCTGMVDSDELLITGSWFVADRATQRAVMFNDDVFETVGNVDTHAFGDYQKILEPKPAGVENYDAPRLSPGGAELFVILESTTDVRTLGRATRDGDTWSTVTPVVVQDETGSVIADLDLTTTSPPTTTTPRRMIASNGIDLLELQEETPLLWRGIARISPQQLGVTIADSGMLVPDGTQLVFQAQGEIRIAERPGLDGPFGASTVLYDPGVALSRSAAFYTVDCQKHLYYARLLNVHHVILP